MSVSKSVDEIKRHKADALAALEHLLDTMISSEDLSTRKKADVLSYWIENYTEYQKREKEFDPRRNISYSRGDIVRVNFGYRIGAEIGGLHYAVVIEKKNHQSANVVTVIPLSSTDGKRVHPSNVDLGTELFNKINDRQKTLLDAATNELTNVQSEISTLKGLVPTDQSSPEQLASYATLYHEWKEKEKRITQYIKMIHTNSKEIAKMKYGSMAVMNQITTISKQRIYTPKKKEDYLYGIAFSSNAMDKINKKLQEKLLF